MVIGTGTQTTGGSTDALFVLLLGGGCQAAICTEYLKLQKKAEYALWAVRWYISFKRWLKTHLKCDDEQHNLDKLETKIIGH
jgi:hypothetical protein